MNRLQLVIILCILGLISCNKKNNSIHSKEIKKYYLVHRNRSDAIDTIKYKNDSIELNLLKVSDSLWINYRKHYITIKKLTNLPNAPTDGEFVAYWEKNVGIFYSRSLTWYNFTILQTDNDSINKYIMGLLGNILLYEKMYTDPKVLEPEIKFVPPTLTEKK